MRIGNNIELQTDEKNIKVCTWLNQISGTTNVLLIKRKSEHHYKEILIVTWRWSISIFSLLPRGAPRRSSLWGRGHLSTCLLHRHICQRCQRSAPTPTPMAPACHNSINNRIEKAMKNEWGRLLFWVGLRNDCSSVRSQKKIIGFSVHEIASYSIVPKPTTLREDWTLFIMLNGCI